MTEEANKSSDVNAGATATDSSNPPVAAENSDMLSLRELQKQRWLEKKNSSTTTDTGTTNTNSATVNNNTTPSQSTTQSQSQNQAAAPSSPTRASKSDSNKDINNKDNSNSRSDSLSVSPDRNSRKNGSSTNLKWSPKAPLRYLNWCEREAKREARLSAKLAQAASSSSSGGSSSNATSAIVGPTTTVVKNEPVLLKKVHISPLGADQSGVPDRDGMLPFLAPTLKRFRSDKTIIYAGKIFEANSCDFIIRDTEPRCGNAFNTVLGSETEFFFAGGPVSRFKRIQFSALTNRLKASELRMAAEASQMGVPTSTPGASSSSSGSSSSTSTNNQQEQSGGSSGSTSNANATATGTASNANTGAAASSSSSSSSSSDPNSMFRINSSVQIDGEEDPNDFSTERIFKEYIAPFFESHSSNEKNGGIFKILAVNETIRINGVTFVCTATDPAASYGIVDKKTLIYVEKDTTPEFRRVHIVPFQDTLPRSYSYDVFTDYLKPFCEAHSCMRFRVNDSFVFNGVQFKVVCCDPPELGGTNNSVGAGGRIGRNTTIYCEGVLHPQLRDLLPPELVAQLAYLPPGLQMLLLSTDAVGSNQAIFERLVEVQDMLQTRRGMSEETINEVRTETIENIAQRAQSENAQMSCMVCLCDFEEGDEVKRLPCNHTFHSGCISEWLRRSCECPICKMNVDRHIRQY